MGETTFTTDKLEFPADHKFEPYIPASTEALLERFGKERPRRRQLGRIRAEKWDENWKFVAGGQAWIDDSKYSVWRNWVLDHMIHHRAQLGVYLRLLGQAHPWNLRAFGGRSMRKTGIRE